MSVKVVDIYLAASWLNIHHYSPPLWWIIGNYTQGTSLWKEYKKAVINELPFVLFQGTLKGFDQTVNLILDESHERVFSSGSGVEQVMLGLYIIRGDNM